MWLLNTGIGITKKNYKHANENFQTHPVHSYINNTHFAKIVQVLKINKWEESQELELLKYA
jgi:hypothetical protein